MNFSIPALPAGIFYFQKPVTCFKFILNENDRLAFNPLINYIDMQHKVIKR